MPNTNLRYLFAVAAVVLAVFAAVAYSNQPVPPQVALPMVLMAGIYVGLEMAAWMEEEAAAHKGPVIDATAEVILEGVADNGATDNALAFQRQIDEAV